MKEFQQLFAIICNSSCKNTEGQFPEAKRVRMLMVLTTSYVVRWNDQINACLEPIS